jgi:hypothetical protein
VFEYFSFNNVKIFLVNKKSKNDNIICDIPKRDDVIKTQGMVMSLSVLY